MTGHSVNNNTAMGLVIFLCSNSNHLMSLTPPKLPQILDIYSVVAPQYHKFCPLDFRSDPKIGILSQLLHLVVTELPKFSSYLVNLAEPCPKFCLKTRY